MGVIEREAEIMVSIYPNPAKENIMIDYSGAVEIRRVELVNSLGQVMLEKEIHFATGSAALDISSLKSGSYVLKIITDHGTIVRQFIKAL